jgi:hypothetical protein
VIKNSKTTGGWLDPRFWLGSDESAVNISRFWIYLAFIGIGLCMICFVRAVELLKTH